MRLPWPFGRRASPTRADPRPPAAGGDHAARGAVGVAEAPPTGAWSTLPAIQRTIGETPAVAPARPFLAGVSGVRSLPPIVEPLGHEHSPLAPPGLVVARAAPVATLTSTGRLPTRPVQRRASHATGAAAIEDPVVATTDPVIAPPSAPAASFAVAASSTPVRRVGIVAPAATAAPRDRPLTRVAAAPAPLPVARTTAPGRTDRAAAAPAPPDGHAAPNQPATRRWAETTPQAGPTGTPPGRRPGLGQPLPAVPSPKAGVPVQRTARASTPPPAPAPRAARPEVATPAGPRRTSQRSPTPPPRPDALAVSPPQRHPVAPGGTPSAPTAQRALEALPQLTLVRRAPPEPAGDRHDHGPVTSRAPSTTLGAASSVMGGPAAPAVATRSSGIAAAGAQLGVQRSTGSGPGHPVVRPTVGRDPLRPRTTVPPVGTSGRAGGADTSAALTRTETAGTPPATPLAGPASGGHAGIAAPPSALWTSPTVAAEHAPLELPSREGGPTALSSPVQRRSAQAAGPQLPSRNGSPVPPLDLARVRASSPTTSGSAAGSEPVVQRYVASGSGPVMVPSVPSISVSGPAGTTLTATPVVQRQEDAAAPAPAPVSVAGGRPGQPHSDRDLDELARALFGRLRTQLRHEVINEREAKGLSFDAF